MTVPDIVGRGISSAFNILGAAGLSIGNEALVFDCTDIPNTVLAQSPSAGQVVLQGTLVNVSLSSLTDGRGRRCSQN